MSQTDVRTFRAATIQEAIEMVRKELGPDAVILQTRELPQPKFFKWRRTNERVEITAGKGVNIRIPKAVSAVPPRNSEAVVALEVSKSTVPREADNLLAPPPALLPPAPSSASASSNPITNDFRSVDESRPAPQAAFDASSLAAPTEKGGSVHRLPQLRAVDESSETISRQLNSIQQMVSQLSRVSLQAIADLPAELFPLFTELIDVEIEEDLARELIHKLKSRQPNSTIELTTAKSQLRSMVETEIRCSPPIAAKPGGRRVVALVGPTGVGKTTTIAKLAANFRLRDGIRMGLVTVDTYRIAAVEQLRTYAEIIDLPMKVVTTPREMRRALDELAGLDLVLIDTAGRSPRDELKIQELKSLLAEACVDEVHLVLSLAASPKSLQATAEKFAAAGTTSVILTKLDEAIGLGSLLSAARRIPLPISYLTTGQDVPDDIEHAHAGRIASLALGAEALFGRRRDGAAA